MGYARILTIEFVKRYREWKPGVRLRLDVHEAKEYLKAGAARIVSSENMAIEHEHLRGRENR